MSTVRILHLSDLHFGPLSRDLVDWKAVPSIQERTTCQERLSAFVDALEKPDFVVVSGDLTVGGGRQGMMDFRDFVIGKIRLGKLPEASRIIVVPGNHDVQRVLRTGEHDRRRRWQDFAEVVGNRFVRPWIPEIDSSEDEMMSFIERSMDARLWGGVMTSFDGATNEQTSRALPFVLDPECGVLIYAFNSASISGTTLSLRDDVMNAIAWIGQATPSSIPEQARLVVDALEEEVRIDPARINPQEFRLLQRIMDRIESRLRAGGREKLWHQLFRIAVLHHHVSPVSTEEFKKFDVLSNSSVFKAELAEAGFHLVLHGHKHDHMIFDESANRRRHRLVVVSGGTIGGAPAADRSSGFFLLNLEGATRRAKIRFVPLAPTGNPRRTIDQAEEESVVVGDSNSLCVRQRLDLGSVFRLTARALFHHLNTGAHREGGEGPGWCHYLLDGRVSMVGTAYGLKVARQLTPYGMPVAIDQVVETLLSMRLPDQGWRHSSAGSEGAEPLPTAWALEALHDWGRSAAAQETAATLPRLFGREGFPGLWTHVFALATLTRAVARVAPSSPFLAELVAALHDGAIRNENGDPVAWPTRCGVLPTNRIDDGAPSAIHTAHAIHALLAAWHHSHGRLGLSPDATRGATAWLLSCEPREKDSEEIYRDRGPSDHAKLPVDHFTLPWVITALLEAEVDPSEPLIVNGINALAGGHIDGLWNCADSMRRPVWATFDAVQALTAYALSA